MKKAIANLSFSDLKVRYFTGRSILISDTGQGKRYQYRNGCMTALGDLEISEWREMISDCIQVHLLSGRHYRVSGAQGYG